MCPRPLLTETRPRAVCTAARGLSLSFPSLSTSSQTPRRYLLILSLSATTAPCLSQAHRNGARSPYVHYRLLENAEKGMFLSVYIPYGAATVTVLERMVLTGNTPFRRSCLRAVHSPRCRRSDVCLCFPSAGDFKGVYNDPLARAKNKTSAPFPSIIIVRERLRGF